MLVKAHPFLLPKCINIAGMSWEPRPEADYVAALTHVCSLLSTVPVDSKARASMAKKFRCASSAEEQKGISTTKSDSSFAQNQSRQHLGQLAVEDALGAMTPAGESVVGTGVSVSRVGPQVSPRKS